MLDFVKAYESGEEFNEEIIKGIRSRDNIYDYLENICKALEAISQIKYDGIEIIKDESKVKIKKDIPIYDSRLELAIMHFTVTHEGKVEHPKIELFIPKAIDNNNAYLINGKKYFGIYQLLDSSTYNTYNSVILKSLLLPIVNTQTAKKIKDIDGCEYVGVCFTVSAFAHDINVMNYFLPTFGFTETLKFFNFEDYFILVDKEENDKDDFIYFKIKNDCLVKTPRNTFNDSNIRNLFFTFYSIFNKKTPFESLDDLEYWTMKLGYEYTRNLNTQLEKGRSVLLSFKRILDETTKNNLRIPPEEKQDIFYLTRWIINNFSALKKKDNLSLMNKRIRYSEYLTIPFVFKLSDNTYRILNSKNITMKKLLTLFKINPMEIVKAMIKTIDLVRYDNTINDNDLFNHYLKLSSTGFQSLNKTSIPSFYRDIYPSHLNRLALNQCSSNEPGVTGCLTPMVKTIDDFYFSESEINNE